MQGLIGQKGMGAPALPPPLPLLANVVYKFKCLRDANNIYIGKTI